MIKTPNRINQFQSTFWVANTLELFERWAYYGMFTVLSVYLTNPVSMGGLGFTQEQRGIMQAIATGVLYLFPIMGGAIADRFGYRKVLTGAFATLAAGYFAMGHFDTYGMVFLSFLLVAVGGAFFKPIIVATVSKTTTADNETLGFGIFYMIVNIGGFIGPFVASKLRDISWSYVFIMSSVVIVLNLLLLFFYREPGRGEVNNDEKLSTTLKTLFTNTITVFKDFRFVLFLIIITGMWIMYMQLFFTLPIYITEWYDTSDLYNSHWLVAKLIGVEENGIGVIRPEMIINIPAFTIILFQVFISNKIKNIHPVKSMIFGILGIAIGYSIFSVTTMGIFLVFATITIAFGEMISSPRIQEYISGIAPKEKVALYMGYSFLPVAGGNVIGGILSGTLYGKLSDKYSFLKEYVVENGLNKADQVASMDGAVLFNETLKTMNITGKNLNEILYNQYSPGNIWFIFAGIGLVTSILLFIYNKYVMQR